MELESKATRREIAKAIAMVSFPAIWPFLNFLDINRDENHSILRLGLYGFAALFVACIGFIAFRVIFRKFLTWRRAGAIFAVGVISFFCYSITYSLAHEIWQGYYLKSWTAFTFITLSLAWYFSRFPLFHNLIFLLGAVLVAVPTAQYLLYQTQLLLASNESTNNQVTAIPTHNTENPPSVFHIILDEYARADVLSEVYDFDNRDFLEELTERGFYIADKAMSNYRRSGLSVPSVLSMEYIFQDDITPRKMAQAKKLLNGGGAVYEWFQKAGYFTALLNYIGAYCEPGSPDYCYTAGGIQYGELESTLIALTPLNSLTNLLISLDVGLAPDYYELWDASKTIAGFKTTKPVFAHIHVLIPHSPHRFTNTCEPVSLVQQQANKALAKGYIGNLQCANIGTLELIDTILRRDPNAIIIVQADHGVRIGFDRDNWKTDDMWEKDYSILNAWRIPPGMDCQKELHPELTSVNTFRIVQACLSETPPDLLPERWFFEDKTNNRYIEIFRK